MAKNILHVVPHDDGWAVKREGNERASSTSATQKDAIESARELAKEQDDIVIHRPDGTIRERVTYTGGNGHNDASDSEGTTIRPRDIQSVGTRVRWSAVFAGVIVAIALYLTMNLLAFAIGLSTVDYMAGRTFAITAAIVTVVTMLAAMFLGGFVASRTTVGEQPSEAMTYGVLVWGTFLGFMLLAGLGAGVGAFSGMRQTDQNALATGDVNQMKQQFGWSDQQAQQYTTYVQKTNNLASQADPTALAWWTFAGVALSLLAAIGGGLSGAGPGLVVRDLRDRRQTTAAGVVAVPRLA